jgi:hypothetical protein
MTSGQESPTTGPHTVEMPPTPGVHLAPGLTIGGLAEAFDPELDYPPDGATVERDGVRFRFDSNGSLPRWTVIAAPNPGQVGGIALPFSDAGVQVARWWKESRS